MEKQINPQEIMEKLVKLQNQVNRLQEDFKDSILSKDDLESLEIAEEEYRKGETVSLEEIERELGMD